MNHEITRVTNELDAAQADLDLAERLKTAKRHAESLRADLERAKAA